MVVFDPMTDVGVKGINISWNGLLNSPTNGSIWSHDYISEKNYASFYRFPIPFTYKVVVSYAWSMNRYNVHNASV